MDSVELDVAIIGGGAVGLAIAHALSDGRCGEVAVFEKNERWGAETSSRNSEVIHAGIYYSPDSLKERLCVEGRDRLYAFAASHDIPYRNCEKIIVAADPGEFGELKKIHANAKRVGAPLEELDGVQVERLEPRVKAAGGLLSKKTGIICSETYVQTLARIVEERGVWLAKRSALTSWQKAPRGYRLAFEQAGEVFEVTAGQVINAAGLHALEVAGLALRGAGFSIQYVRGHYFRLASRWGGAVGRLIYPLPDEKGGGLGVHLTLDTNGGCRLGPDTDWRSADRVDYSFSDTDENERRPAFFSAASRYLKDLKIEDLSRDFVGVRPKRVGNDGKMLDFYIAEESARGYPGWINLVGIESPGLTASLAIGEEVRHKIV